MRIPAFGLFCLLGFSAHAQVQLDRPLEMTGGSGQRAVTNLEPPVNGTDAANKDYVDNAIESLQGGSFTFSVTPGRSTVTFYEAPGYQDTTRIVVKRLSGTPGVVTLSASGLPAGVNWDLYAGGGYVSYQSTLQMRRASPLTPGTYPVTITATGGGNTITTSFNLVVVNVKRVFITSTTYTGNLGGLTGADDKCQARADAASLGGTWKAWISSNTVSAASRLNNFNGPHILMNGAVIATTWADLMDGMLLNPINRTEFNGNAPLTYGGYPATWSNTNGNGTSATYDCTNWSNGASGYGFAGISFAGASMNEWTRWTEINCSFPQALYCFEQ